MPEPHWTEDLFVGHDEIFLRIHELGWPDGEGQARDVREVLGRFGVPEGGRILDAPCGIGRHSTRLAKMGYRVLGLDLSPAYVRRAQELAEAEGVSARVQFRVGDMRSLGAAVPEAERPFDAALNLWTSLGYYGEESDLEILRGYRALVRPGGLMVLYIVNRDWLVRHFDPQGLEEFGDLVHIEDRHLDLEASWMRNTWRFFRKQGEDLESLATIAIEHRVYSLHELRSLLERAGWKIAGTFSGYKMEPVTFDIASLLMVGRK